MPFCQHCGHQLDEPEAEAAVDVAAETAAAAEGVAEQYSSADVEIERIRADKEIKLAKIQRGIASEAIEAETAVDAAKAEILDDVLTPPAPEPIPVEVAGPAEPETPDEEPPPVVDTAPEPEKKGGGNPWW